MVNNQISEFGNVLLFILGGISFVLIALTVAKFIRPSRPNEEKLAPYECGEEAVGNPWTNFNIRFYVIALIFVLFEVEIIFLFPWAVVFGNAELIKQTNGLWGWFSVIEVFLFIFILTIGLAYAWVKGFLDWIQPASITEEFKSKIPTDLYEAVNKKYETKANVSNAD
ncbi:MAG TPA: NADH-quinone oxidoreductase subunit A [Cytophagaceae bacterium]|jgi:NADH-quinone oxidoreductase subunit A|nr:NADH-quinone oxidoreductase subunit A [Cytophagaceae bacterium]